MRFSISSAELKEQLNIINGAIGSNPVLPILEDFLFILEDEKLIIVATDLETFITAELPVQAEVKGSIAVPAKILRQRGVCLRYPNAHGGYPRL